MVFSTLVMIKLISAAFTLGFAYAAWNVGILHGNVTIMAVGSYFTPVLSSALAAGAAQRPAVVLILARRANGLRRFPALLAGDTSWLK